MSGAPRRDALTDRDLELLRAAIDLSVQARLAGDPPFGALLTDGSGTVLVGARNASASDDDITAHPELKLARHASAHRLVDTVLYTSCRPCPMCTNAIARSGITRVVFALDTADLYALKPPGYRNPDAHHPEYVGPRPVAPPSYTSVDRPSPCPTQPTCWGYSSAVTSPVTPHPWHWSSMRCARSRRARPGSPATRKMPTPTAPRAPAEETSGLRSSRAASNASSVEWNRTRPKPACATSGAPHEHDRRYTAVVEGDDDAP